MSNLIKAYSIKYNENEKKVIDMNDKAELFQQLYLDKIHAVKTIFGSTIKSEESIDDDGEEAQFIEGLSALAIEREETSTAGDNERSMKELEEQLDEKKRKLEEESKRILEDAKEEVKRQLAQAELEANERKIEILEKAKQDGFNQGLQAAQLEIDRIKSELEDEKQQLQQEYEVRKREMEPAFVELLIFFVKKFTGYALEEKKDIILYLVEQAFRGIENSNSYIIKVSKEDFDMVYSKRTELLWKLRDGVVLEVVDDHLLSYGQCLIETDSRVIDCSLDVQLKNLTSDLRLLAGTPLEEGLLGD